MSIGMGSPERPVPRRGMRREARRRWARLLVASTLALLPISCGSTPDPGEAASVFATCLERNGIVFDGLSLTLNPDGTVATIELQMVGEGAVPYEPAARIACTEEVEAGR